MPYEDFPTWVEISKRNLLHNIAITKRELNKQTKVLAVVKSNAYGHGLKEVIRTTQAFVDGFCVASTEEALLAKNYAPSKRILVLSYFTTLKQQHLTLLAKKGIEVPIFSLSLLNRLSRQQIPLRVNIKIDTGTTRIGIQEKDLPQAIKILNQNPQLIVRGVYSHFADVENKKSNFSRVQLARFETLTNFLQSGLHRKTNLERHMACSAAIARHKKSHFEAVRLGIHLYGLKSEKITNAYVNSLRPVLSWKTKLLQAKPVDRGTTVGYNRTYKAQKPMRIGVIPVGYWDGYDRKLSNTARVGYKGKLLQIVGNICMNVSMIDMRNVRYQDDAVIDLIDRADKRLSADAMAKTIGTINYEVVTRINPLLPRILV